MTDDRETLIDLLNRSGVDYDASEKDTVVIETDQPHVCTDRRPTPEDLWGAGLEASARIIENLTTGPAAEERSRWRRLVDRLRGR